MQDFVVSISNYAHNYVPNFIIIPQNGVELAFQDADSDKELNATYFNAINGLGVEELFYNGALSKDDYRLNMLQKLSSNKPILVSEFVQSTQQINAAYQLKYQQGFKCFVRDSSNYYYTNIPAAIPNANSSDITNLNQVQNYLYLINSEKYASKSDFIAALQNTNYDLIIMDLFFNNESFSKTEIEQLKIKANGAKRLVISYINIGSAEKYRYYWKKSWGLHHPLWIRRKYEGYDDEYWVKFWKKDWQEIIYGNDDSYIKKIINAGFDGAYLDNTEAYYFLYYKD